jgi:uncharacterized membrane protein YfcA
LDWGSISIWLIAAVLAVISVGALVKGMTGLGLPLFAVPAIAMLTSVEEAVVLMIIPGLGSNIWLVLNHRRFSALLREHLPFLLAGFVGGIAGTFLLVAIDDRWLKLVLAAWLALYLIQYVLGDIFKSVFQARGAGAALVGAAAGTIQGATGVSAHIVAPYFHNRHAAPEAYAFLVACAFLTFSLAQLSTAVSTQLFTPERLTVGLIALVPTLLFTRVGIALAGKISNIVFQRILLVVFLAMEMKLITDVI